MVDNLEQPSALGNGEQPSAHGDGLPIVANVVAPIVDLEDVPSRSLNSIAIDFAMLAVIDSPTLEFYVH